MNFKKILAVILAVFAVAPLTGCSSGGLSKAQLSDILKTASEKTADEKSYTAAMDVDFAVKDDGKSSEASVDTSINSMESPLNRHIKISTKQNGKETSNSEFYVDTQDKTQDVYFSYQNGWYKVNVNSDELNSMLGQYDIKEVINILLTNSTNATVGDKEDVNKTECYKVDAVIPADNVPKTILSTGVFVVTGLVNLTEEHMSGVKDMPVTFWVNSKTGEVMKFAFDAGPVYQKIVDNAYEALKNNKDADVKEDAKNISVGKFEITTDISDINNTKKTEIPKDVLSAKDVTGALSGETGNSSSASQSSASSSQQSSEQTENK
ncbi:MAG: hypothetical protein LKJ25_06310 [Clostridia bacterium]|jgi:hypothetical protein|nr:hypothetical protein [Clostridia bacterium]